MRKTALRIVIPQVTALLGLIGCGTDIPTQPREAVSPPESITWDQLAMTLPPSGAEMTFHGGRVLTQPKVVAVFWATSVIYANGPTPGSVGDGTQDASLVGYFLSHLGGSNYWSILTTYTDSTGAPVQNSIPYTGYWANNVNVPPSDNFTIVSMQAIEQMLWTGFNQGKIQYDSNTIYAVFTAGNTDLSGIFQSGRCARHTAYADPSRGVVLVALMPRASSNGWCVLTTSSPNGDGAADVEVSNLAHELAEAVTDPLLGTGWTYDASSPHQENADMCYGYYGAGIYPTGLGGANVRIGIKDFMIQTNWANIPGGGCVLGLIHNGYSVTSVLDVPVPVRSAGTYFPDAGSLSSRSYDAVTYRWQVSSSNGSIPPSTSEFLPAGTFSVYVPGGS